MKQITPTHVFTYDGTVINIFCANKGEGLPMHSHQYSHASFCTAGSCRYTQEGKTITANKLTQPINLVGGKNHAIEALEDGTVFVNVFSESKL